MIFKPSLEGPNNQIKPLAFVEWFNLSRTTDPDINMFTATKARDKNGQLESDIIYLEDIVQPCPLIPKFGESVAVLERKIGISLNCTNILEFTEEFWVNSFHSKATYQTVY